MMTKNELTDTKAQLNETKSQLDATLKQINSMAALVNAHLYPVQLDTMATMSKHVCSVTIKVTEFKDKKENNVEEWYSIPFYSHNEGYKMCLLVDAPGYGDSRGTHLSASLFLMKGPHDNELTWPMRGEFEIKLLTEPDQ